jgi:hypothetical protein
MRTNDDEKYEKFIPGTLLYFLFLVISSELSTDFRQIQHDLQLTQAFTKHLAKKKLSVISYRQKN